MNNGISATGSIRGFTNIDLGQGQTPESIVPTNFSLTDLMCRIENIRTTYDPDALNDIITQILTHIQNYNNPHEVNLSQSAIDVLNVVYQEWLNNGNTGTIQDFYAVFFQVTNITSVSGTAALTAPATDLITVSGVEAFISQHNTDPNAHSELLDIIIPGTPPSQLPTTAYNAQFGIPVNTTTSRTTPICVIDPNGNLATVPALTIAIDHSTGTPAFPLYGSRTNAIFPSDPILQPTTNLFGATNSLSPAGTLKVGPDGQPCMVLTESSANQFHGYKIGVTLTEGVQYTHSVFVYPFSNSGGIVLYLHNQSGFAIMLDLSDYSVTSTNGSVIGYAYPLPNGWVRIGMQYVSPVTGSENISIATTQSLELNGSYAYQGTESLMFGIFGLQCVEGCGMSPYIPTTTAPVSHDSTEMTITTNLANATTGLLSVSYNHAPTVGATVQSVIALNANLKIAALNGNIIAQTQNLDGSSVSLELPNITNENIITVFSFSPSLYKLGSTGSSKISQSGTPINLTTGSISIVLGSTTTPLDGNISSLILYPVSDTNEEIEFLLGEA